MHCIYFNIWSAYGIFLSLHWRMTLNIYVVNCPDSSMIRLPLYVYKNTRYTITHYYFCKLLDKPFIYLDVCNEINVQTTINLKGLGGGMGWLPVHFKSIYTIYLLQLPTCVYLVNDIINNCLCRIPRVPCLCYMIYAVGQPFENC